ncbi:MAG TPA: hypothetical protein VEW69_05985 [Alphaproteobacteria bacterium]|nr:hypothetical protein [Alphaproteobacteria bacterium]
MTSGRMQHAPQSTLTTTATAAAVVTLLMCIAMQPALAVDKIYSPYVEEGEIAVEYAGDRTFDANHDKNNIQEHQFSLEYGATSRWETEFYANFDKEPGTSFRMSGVEWENRFQLAEQNQYWADPGLLISYAHAFHAGEPDGLEVKLLLAKDAGRFTHVANLGFEQEIGSHASGGPDYVFLWSSRYRYSPYVQPGFEIQSDFGHGQDLPFFNRQEHYIGPALYGMIIPHLKYQAAYLAGVSDAAARAAPRFQLEYEMRF